jgi:hypothetical protein
MLEGSPGAEAIRKHYRELEKNGRLPEISGHIGHKQAALREEFQRQRVTLEKAKQDLVAAEEGARALGLDLNGNIADLIEKLKLDAYSRSHILNSEPRIQVDYIKGSGITDSTEAEKFLADCERERQQIEQQVNVLSAVHRLRRLARDD